MSRPPLVLVSPDIEAKGKEFGDLSISLSGNYQQSLMSAGAIPVTLAATRSRELLAESVRRCDGVLLTGGDDIDPRLYANGLPARVRRTVDVTPDGGERDLRELIVIDEVFRQRKPLLQKNAALDRYGVAWRHADGGHSLRSAGRVGSSANGQTRPDSA